MNNDNEKLSALLQQWREIETKANFESDVLRQIHRAQLKEPERARLIDLLQQWLGRPTVAVAAAGIVSVIIGTSGELLTMSKSTATANSEMNFMAQGTLAGGYTQLAGERGR